MTWIRIESFGFEIVKSRLAWEACMHPTTPSQEPAWDT